MSKRKSKKVAILGCLSSLEPTYSVAGVVADQLNVLSKYEDLVFITTDDFKDQSKVPEGVDIRYYPRYRGDLKEIDPIEFEKYVFELTAILKVHLSDVATCIQHDLLFIESFLPIAWALRRTAVELPNLKWLHWMHSAPSKRQILEYPFNSLYMDMNNSTFIVLNRSSIEAGAIMYQLPENIVRVVHNMVDPVTHFRLHPVATEIVQSFQLLEADTICVYPTRMTSAKQPDKIIKLLGKLRDRGQKVKLIICNSWSNADQEKEYIRLLKSESILSSVELIFTSEFDSKWCKENNYPIELGIPKEAVIGLMQIADLFILPSISEACSMIMLEAGLCKNLTILNDDLLSLHEWGGQKMNGNCSHRTLYMSFGSLSRPIGSYLPSEEEWYQERACELEAYQENNQAINFFKLIRKRHNPDWVYHNQIKPLLST